MYHDGCGAVQIVLHLTIQLAVILGTCRLVSLVLERLGQTKVASEMVAGLMLGPSLFGLVAPHASEWLFPRAPVVLASGAVEPNPSMAILGAIARVGLVLYMFLVGAELDLSEVRGRAKSAALVSASGIAAPFVLGALSSIFLRRAEPGLFGTDVAPSTAALYLGVAMSITAFPMLARILHERGLARGRLGTLTLAAGATDDVIAWCLLALLLAWTKHDPKIGALAVFGSIAYVAVVHFVVRRWILKRLAAHAERLGRASHAAIVTLLALLFAGAFVTDAIGVHAVFGAFVLGTALPRGVLSREMFDKLEPITVSVLVPVFFVNAGLGTSIGLLDRGSLWVIVGGLTAVAVIGKLGACAIAARASGESWRDALTVGTLMNTRGMMGLIILGIGLEQKVLGATLYTMLVLVAVVTTLATSPLLSVLLKPATASDPDRVSAKGTTGG